MALLVEFALRLSFGLGGGMLLVSPRYVASGYFRNHLYVTLGLAALAAIFGRVAAPAAFLWALSAAIASYVGSVMWLYEKPRAGRAMLAAVAAISLIGAWAAQPLVRPALSATGESGATSGVAVPLAYAQTVTSGSLLGVTMAAMLLGHWYLNAPGMELAPLRRLLVALAAAATVQALVCGGGLALEVGLGPQAAFWWLFVALRWLFGLAGIVALVAMAWQTLAIPNTQSATGILYVAVIGTFVGETMSLLLSVETLFPV